MKLPLQESMRSHTAYFIKDSLQQSIIEFEGFETYKVIKCNYGGILKTNTKNQLQPC